MDYSGDLIQVMKKFYQSLSEKDRRRYAAIEAQKLGHGGISYIAKIFGCSRETVKSGLQQLESLEISELNTSEIRKPGAGRKRTIKTTPGLEGAFESIIQEYGESKLQQGKIGLSQRQIAELLQQRGFRVSLTVVKQLITQYKQQN